VKVVCSAPEFAHYPEAFHLSPAVAATGLLLFSGQTGVRPDGTIADDPETLMRDAFVFLGMNLAAAGSGFPEIVEMTTYHLGLRDHLATFIKVKDEFVHAPYPAWTAVGISELWTPGSIIEIRVIARRGLEHMPRLSA
jgi:enamine deaminase RidA (YjgF/YER057c/UK114 family)